MNTSLEHYQAFSTLHASSVCCQADVGVDDKEKISCTAQHDLLRCTRLQFGLKKNCSTSQRILGTILETIKWQYVTE